MSTSFNPTDASAGFQWRDADGKVIAEIARGQSDADRVYLKLYDANGLATYIYPTTGGTSLTVTTTQP